MTTPNYATDNIPLQKRNKLNVFESNRNKDSDLNSTLKVEQHNYQQQHFPTLESRNHSPFQKLNEIRNQHSKSKQNLILLSARVKALEKQKQKNAKQAQWAKHQIEFIRTVRNRLHDDSKRKQQFYNKKQSQENFLAKKANNHRSLHKQQKYNAVSDLLQQKIENSSNVKRETLQNTYLRKQFEQTIAMKNKNRVKQIQKMEQGMQLSRQTYLAQLHQRAKSNKQRKIQQQLMRKKKTENNLRTLVAKEQALLEQIKMSETTKINEFKNLQRLLHEKETEMDRRQNKSVYNDIFKKVFSQSQKKLQNPQISISYY